MSNDLSFWGRSASSYGLRIGGVDVYRTTGNSVQTITVPGRVGAVIPVDQDYLSANEIREYSAACYLRAASMASVEEKMATLRQWLLTHTGYQTLKDTYEPSFYRRAFFSGEFAPVRKGAGQNFQIQLRFSCDPRRYLDNVEDTVLKKGGDGALTAVITPPQAWATFLNYPIKPLIKVENCDDDFTLAFTDATYTEEYGKITFESGFSTLYFDTETMSASLWPDGYGNMNSYITDVTGRLEITGLTTYIKRNNVDAKITITPRWWVR